MLRMVRGGGPSGRSRHDRCLHPRLARHHRGAACHPDHRSLTLGPLAQAKGPLVEGIPPSEHMTMHKFVVALIVDVDAYNAEQAAIAGRGVIASLIKNEGPLALEVRTQAPLAKFGPQYTVHNGKLVSNPI